MKTIIVHTHIKEDGRVDIPEKIAKATELRPGDRVCVTLEPMVNEPDDELEAGDELFVPAELLEAAGIPADNELDVICIEGAVIIREADILNNLPEEFRELLDALDVDPDVVRGVMRKEGYFV